jgi:hypothetical protein
MGTGEKKKKKKKKRKPIWYKSTQEESLESLLFFAYSLDTVKLKIHYWNCLPHYCFGLYAQVTGVCLRSKLWRNLEHTKLKTRWVSWMNCYAVEAVGAWSEGKRLGWELICSQEDSLKFENFLVRRFINRTTCSKKKLNFFSMTLSDEILRHPTTWLLSLGCDAVYCGIIYRHFGGRCCLHRQGRPE